MPELIWVKSTTMHLLGDRNILNVVLTTIGNIWGEWLLRLMVASIFGVTFNLTAVSPRSFQTHNWHWGIGVKNLWLPLPAPLLIGIAQSKFRPHVWNPMDLIVRLRALGSFNTDSCLNTGLIDVGPSPLILVDHLFDVWLGWGGQLSWPHDVGDLARLVFEVWSHWRLALTVLSSFWRFWRV